MSLERSELKTVKLDNAYFDTTGTHVYWRDPKSKDNVWSEEAVKMDNKDSPKFHSKTWNYQYGRRHSDIPHRVKAADIYETWMDDPNALPPQIQEREGKRKKKKNNEKKKNFSKYATQSYEPKSKFRFFEEYRKDVSESDGEDGDHMENRKDGQSPDHQYQGLEQVEGAISAEGLERLEQRYEEALKDMHREEGGETPNGSQDENPSIQSDSAQHFDDAGHHPSDTQLRRDGGRVGEATIERKASDIDRLTRDARHSKRHRSRKKSKIEKHTRESDETADSNSPREVSRSSRRNNHKEQGDRKKLTRHSGSKKRGRHNPSNESSHGSPGKRNHEDNEGRKLNRKTSLQGHSLDRGSRTTSPGHEATNNHGSPNKPKHQGRDNEKRPNQHPMNKEPIVEKRNAQGRKSRAGDSKEGHNGTRRKKAPPVWKPWSKQGRGFRKETFVDDDD